MNIIGFIGSTLLALCGLPEFILAVKNKDSQLSWTFLSIWQLGEIFTLIAIINDAPLGYLLLNYSANIFFISGICYYKFTARKHRKK